MMRVQAEENAHSANWLNDILSVFVNEPAPPHVRSQQGQCVLNNYERTKISPKGHLRIYMRLKVIS